MTPPDMLPPADFRDEFASEPVTNQKAITARRAR